MLDDCAVQGILAELLEKRKGLVAQNSASPSSVFVEQVKAVTAKIEVVKQILQLPSGVA